jgi:nitrogen fixation/metabolism regulation signal transduction histidine kinase
MRIHTPPPAGRRWTRPLAIGLALLLLAALLTMNAATQNATRFGTLYLVILGVNATGLLAVLTLIVIELRRLVGQLRRKEGGSRLTLRLLLFFASLSVPPVAVVYFFSLDALDRGIDTWFDLGTEQALRDSLDLSRAALDARMGELLKQTEQMAETLGEPSDSLEDFTAPSIRAGIAEVAILDTLREHSDAEELSIFGPDGRLLATSSRARELIPHPLPQNATVTVKGRSYIGLDRIADAGFQIRVLVSLPEARLGQGSRTLQAFYPVATRINELAVRVEAAYERYNELSYLRSKLKLSFIMTLTLALLFAVLGSLWAAFHSARRLTSPIRDLALGTQAVAAGDYGTNLPVTSQDEMGFLVRSFNDMTARIRLARDEVEAQRTYLETVLRQLSSGVLTCDPAGRLFTVNAAARQILGLDLDAGVGTPLAALATAHPHIEPFVAACLEHLPSGQDWRREVVFLRPGGRAVLLCRGTPLHAEPHLGQVVVFDDITALIQGQRDAAWSEVARRLAHEIKNPLTPIQLSAERLRHKYLKTMPPEDAEVLDRLTHTIVQQVEALKAMVNAFSDYARPPKIAPAPVDLNRLVEEILDLYRGADTEARLLTTLDPVLPPVEVDPQRLRQVLHNLVKNALEARRVGEPVTIAVTTAYHPDAAGGIVELTVADRGAGVPPEVLPRIFEPYVTNKVKGTGLGLAIVKKIVEEHGGMVGIANRPPPEGGTRITIHLPLRFGGGASEAAAEGHGAASVGSAARDRPRP